MVTLRELIPAAQRLRTSDIHIVCGLPIRVRIDGDLVDFPDCGDILTYEDCIGFASELTGLSPDRLGNIGEIDKAVTIEGLRCRVNVFCQQGTWSIALRILADHIPDISVLGLPPIVSTFADFPRGIVLVTGETGSGKSTTLAALLDKINHTRAKHIITLEDPVEYVYKPDKCTVCQREIGADTESYDNGMRAILRQDPDIILIGEMRGLDTIETALTASETGHLVFATLHTNSAADAIDRIVNVFPGDRQSQIRMQLSTTLRAVLAQQLLPKKGGSGRVLACEIMVVNSAIKNLIREGKTPQIANAITTSANEGNISMDNHLIKLAKANLIAGEVAAGAAHEADYVRKSLGISSPLEGMPGMPGGPGMNGMGPKTAPGGISRMGGR